ncbi:hypothetical protein [Winogradskya consettensis]|uniref:hypothetical protein n=1 Tax=Winogradskya consettensis TaxID=113560 RepID=UPI001BB3CBB7|nr:hypothetical protein [Actinoplanes consettensis]
MSEAILTRLRRFVESEGAYLHVVPQDQIPMLAVSTEQATGAERNDPAYREELNKWTNRPQWRGDGVPPSTAVQPTLRRVGVRDFVPEGATGGLTAGDGFTHRSSNPRGGSPPARRPSICRIRPLPARPVGMIRSRRIFLTDSPAARWRSMSSVTTMTRPRHTGLVHCPMR